MKTQATHITPEEFGLRIAAMDRQINELRKIISEVKPERPRLLSIPEVAEIIGVKPGTLRHRWYEYPFFTKKKNMGIKALNTKVYEYINNEYNG